MAKTMRLQSFIGIHLTSARNSKIARLVSSGASCWVQCPQSIRLTVTLGTYFAMLSAISGFSTGSFSATSIRAGVIGGDFPVVIEVAVVLDRRRDSAGAAKAVGKDFQVGVGEHFLARRVVHEGVADEAVDVGLDHRFGVAAFLEKSDVVEARVGENFERRLRQARDERYVERDQPSKSLGILEREAPQYDRTPIVSRDDSLLRAIRANQRHHIGA